VARDLIAAISEGSDLVVAASMPFRDVEAFGAPRSGIRFLGNRGANGIDGFIGTCVGAATTSGRPTFALSGDLSLLHDQDALIGARERKVDLTIVVIDNDGGGIFSFLPQAALPEHFEKVFGTPHGLDLADLARLYGVNHERIESPGDLQSSARRAPQGVTIVEVRTDRTTPSAPPFLPQIRNAMRDIRGSETVSVEDRHHRLQLETRLFELCLRLGGLNHASTREHPAPGAVHLGAAQGDRPFSVPVGIDPSDRTGIAPAVHPFEPAYRLERVLGRCSANSSRWM
jgi:hypothetical protein